MIKPRASIGALLPFSPIFTINFLSDLIKFEDYVKKFLNSLWIQPIFTIIPLNSSEFPKIGKFGIIFDAISREIDDLAVSSRHGPIGIVGPGYSSGAVTQMQKGIPSYILVFSTNFLRVGLCFVSSWARGIFNCR